MYFHPPATEKSFKTHEYIAHLWQECHNSKIWHFLSYWYRKKTFCRCTFSRYSVITQFAKLAAGEQLCRRCAHRKLRHFQKSLRNCSRKKKITDIELWHCCCRKWGVCWCVVFCITGLATEGWEVWWCHERARRLFRSTMSPCDDVVSGFPWQGNKLRHGRQSKASC